MFVVVRDFDFESFDDVIGPFNSEAEAQAYADSRSPTHWNYHVVELTAPEVIN